MYSEPAAYGTPEKYREEIYGTAWSVGLYAEQIQRYCELGDDAGLDYSIRSLIACTKSAATVLVHLKEMKATLKERAEA